jgi:hypothetical protein
MLASLAWGLLFLAGKLQMWHAVVLLVIHGAAGVVGAPATQLMIHDMVPPEDLPSAIRLNASSRYLSILLGPAVGGGLMLLLGPAWGLLTNVLIYLPFTILLMRFAYTGHAARGAGRTVQTFGLGDAWNVFAAVRTESRIITMVIVAGATSFLVGNAFQAQMPAYANFLGADETGTRYTVLLAADAVGAVIGVLLLETANFSRPTVQAAIASAGLWGVTMGLFPLTTAIRRQLCCWCWQASSTLRFSRCRRRSCSCSRLRQSAAASSVSSTWPCWVACGQRSDHRLAGHDHRGASVACRFELRRRTGVGRASGARSAGPSRPQSGKRSHD